jgi:hypothetical protein
MAVDSTPDRSFSLLFRSSRAALATTGCPAVVVALPYQRAIELYWHDNPGYRRGSQRYDELPVRSCSANGRAYEQCLECRLL